MRNALPTLALLALCACSSHRAGDAGAGTSAATVGNLHAAAGNHAFSPAITPGDFAEHVQQLASDAFAGRGPGTAGEDRTVAYIRSQFARIGLQPGNGADWFQAVPMVGTTASPSTTLSFTAGDTVLPLAFGTEMVVGTRSGQAHVNLKDSPLVFVGYGVDAPERDWNDYAGIDVRGKTVVMLVNDPGFHANDPHLFDGRRMTWYGRWVYKFEEAARKGAAAALIIHDTAGASYGWDVVKSSWSGPQYDLPPQDDPAPRLQAQGWITGDAATALFKAAGQNLDALRAAANRPGFRAVPLDATASLSLDSKVVHTQSRNVLGLLPGSDRSGETLVYMAHWDHLGTQASDAGAAIYHGAVDNATGVAGLLELAESLRSAPVPPRRSILFLAVTLEESGLLGSRYYVAHPAIPLDKTVAAINLDAMLPIGKARDMVVVGRGSSQLEDLLKPILARQQRHVADEADPAAGYYFRSDHFNFAKAGVPALYIGSGTDLLDGGRAAGEAATRGYTSERYHQPADTYAAGSWKLDGILQDLEALRALGDTLANTGQWPNWYAGSPFRATRDAMRPSAAPRHDRK